MKLLLLALALPPATARAAQAPHLLGVPRRTELTVDPAVLPLEVERGWPVVEAWFGDRGPYRMVVDTGAMGLVLYGDLAKELGLEVVGETRIGDPSAPEANAAELVQVPELRVGDARFEEVVAVTWADAPRRGALRGIVGLPVFAGCAFTLDYPGNALTMTLALLPETTAGWHVLPLRRDAAGIVEVPVTIAGREHWAHLDSGNSTSLILPGRLRPETPVVAGSLREARGLRASGEVTFTVAQLDGDVAFAGATFERPEIRFDPGLPALNVGATILGQFALTIDQRNARIAFRHGGAEPPIPAAAAAIRGHGERRLLGVEMRNDGGPMRVDTVRPGSLAERAGVRAADVLLAVDGEAIDHEKPGALVRALAGTNAFTLAVERAGERVELTVPGE